MDTKAGLLERIRKLRDSDLSKAVGKRLIEFEKTGGGGVDGVFCELCFCILTANYAAQRAISIQEDIGGGFLSLPEKSLARRLKVLGHRFPNARARYIVEARKHHGSLGSVLREYDGLPLRRWFVDNVRGVGFKEASHFLRNIGYTDYAILDFHILDVLEENKIIMRPKTMTAKRYLEIEDAVRKLGDSLNMNMAELDLYLWYLETGRILK
jgi:N-glycosylase/DNA lyase